MAWDAGSPLGLALLLAQVAAVAFFAYAAYHKGWLTFPAAATAFALGSAIVLSTNVLWLLVLLSLLAFGSLATRWHYAEKAAKGVAEAKGGARRVKNVLANGLVPTLVAVLTPLLASAGVGANVAAITFVSAVAGASADTLASEFGSLSDKVYLITTARRVPPGTDGGVSLPGQLAALLGAALIALVGLLLLGLLVPLLAPGQGLRIGLAAAGIPILAGFVGCQVDSLLGATLELRGLINKEEVNILGILAGAVVGFALGLVA
jgi:uncharacterized protein (TIGR00297 family)